MIKRMEAYEGTPSVSRDQECQKRDRVLLECSEVLSGSNQSSPDGSPLLKRASTAPTTPLLRSSSSSQEIDPQSDEGLIFEGDQLFFACKYNEAKETYAKLTDKPGWILKRLAVIETLISAKHPHKGEGKKGPLEKMANNLRHALIQQSNEWTKKFVLNQDSEIFLNLTMSAISAQNLNCELPGVVAFTQGGRPYMEDTFFSYRFALNLDEKEHHFEIYGVFDGHGGVETAAFARDHFFEHFHHALLQHQNLTDEGMYLALHSCMINLDKAADPLRSGTTASVAIIWEQKVFVANVGDSRTILSDDGIPVQLSHDAKLSERRTQKKVIKLGGNIIYDKGTLRAAGRPDKGKPIGLSLGGSIGDCYIKGESVKGAPPVCCFPAQPQITCYSLEGVEYLVIACDGIWDVCSTDQAIDAIGKCKQESLDKIAKRIVYCALQSGSTDNITLMIIPRI